MGAAVPVEPVYPDTQECFYTEKQPSKTLSLLERIILFFLEGMY